MLAQIIGAGLFFKDHPHRFPLDHAVAHLGQLQHPLQQAAVVFVG